jgi:hypothetical protein
MRKLIGLCFLTATLLASSANAQSIFIDKGDPSTVGFSLGGHYGGLYGGSFNLAYSYRGVLDIGLDASGTHFTTGDLRKYNALNFMPFMNFHVVRSDADEFPISIALLVGVERAVYTSSSAGASPSGWGVAAGASLYRRIEIGSSFAVIPEFLGAYEYTYTRNYTVPDPSPQNGKGYRTDTQHNGRALVRLNLGLKTGNHVLTVTPYGGHAGYYLGRVVGLTLGFVI